ncbi:S1C family serine protease [Pseudomonas sp. S1(2024)]|uniref:S1C family serine protease n=1 Tax=Pseudomonas sp. S1(2024) TaxID=3390191 RepID=UPI0039793DA9
MLKNLVTTHLSSSVMIATPGTPSFIFLCSGFICSNKGYILTCAHALDLTKEIYIATPPDPNSFPHLQGLKFHFVKATIAQFDPLNDVALLKVEESNFKITGPKPSIAFGDEREAAIGTTVGYFGFPFAARGLILLKSSQSIVSAKVTNERNARSLVLDSAVNDGNSGGPLIDATTNKVIGIISGRYSPSGTQPVALIGGIALGQDSNISFATGISYGIDLMKAEGIYE